VRVCVCWFICLCECRMFNIFRNVSRKFLWNPRKVLYCSTIIQLEANPYKRCWRCKAIVYDRLSLEAALNNTQSQGRYSGTCKQGLKPLKPKNRSIERAINLVMVRLISWNVGKEAHGHVRMVCHRGRLRLSRSKRMLVNSPPGSYSLYSRAQKYRLRLHSLFKANQGTVRFYHRTYLSNRIHPIWPSKLLRVIGWQTKVNFVRFNRLERGHCDTKTSVMRRLVGLYLGQIIDPGNGEKMRLFLVVIKIDRFVKKYSSAQSDIGQSSWGSLSFFLILRARQLKCYKRWYFSRY